jgi:hypothetical protein
MSIFRKNFYSSIQEYDAINLRAFDEGPLIIQRSIGINSSSISTKEIDKYRQGVEITQEKYTTGLVKISAGTSGHIIRPKAYGINDLDIISENSYIEIDYFNPKEYIEAQEPGKTLKKVITFPIITSDENQAENYSFNGIIEPLSIRPVASFFSIEFPFESHAVRGALMNGNSDSRFASSEQVLSVDYFGEFNKEKYYLDAFQTVASGSGVPLTTIGYVSENYSHVKPFDDNKIYLKSLGIKKETHGSDMVEVFLKMTGSTGNYVAPDKKSATTGFIYDNIGAAGIDSIAFGGMTY